MRFAVISDIHGNLQAFEKVLDDIDSMDIDKIYSLGDNINYGANSNEVIGLLIEKQISSVIGNHENAAVDISYQKWFSDNATKSIDITRRQLTKQSIEYIDELPDFLIENHCHFVHGIPPADFSTYIEYCNNDELVDIFRNLKAKIAFVGHTHIPLCFEYSDNKIKRKLLVRKPIKLNRDAKYIINPGSVGQPRDNDPYVRAKYVVVDFTDFTVELRHVDYDYNTAMKTIIKAGYPRSNADRLKP